MQEGCCQQTLEPAAAAQQATATRLQQSVPLTVTLCEVPDGPLISPQRGLAYRLHHRGKVRVRQHGHVADEL